MTAQQLIKINEVIRLTALSRSSVYDKASKNKFPKPIKIGIRSSGWVLAEVTAWIDTQISLSRAASPARTGKNNK